MVSCAIFGHSEYNYESYTAKIEEKLLELIKNANVTQFFLGGRGAFDALCVKLLRKLQMEFSAVKIIQVYAYIPQEKRTYKNDLFDASVYLLERRVPPLYAIIESNKCMVKKVDYIFSGIMHEWGGAWQAVNYAKKQGKRIVTLLKSEGEEG